MPDWLADIGRRTPNGWALETLKGILAGTAGAGEVAAGALGTLVLGAVLFQIARARIVGGFGSGS